MKTENSSFWNGRLLFWLFLGVLALIVVIMAIRPQAVWIDTATVTRQNLVVSIIEEGQTRVKDRYIMSAPVSGYLRRVLYEVGDQVEPGQLLTQLEPLKSEVLDTRTRAEAEARVAAAKASLSSAEQIQAAALASWKLADKDHTRKKQLAEQQLIAQEQLDRSSAELERLRAEKRSSEFNVDVARHELAAAETLLRVSSANQSSDPSELVDIRSPIAGSVLQRFRQSEGVVQPGQTLLEIGDPSALEVVVDVQSFDAVKLNPDMPVELRGWGGEALQAKVSNVEPVGFTEVSALGVEEQRVRVVVDILDARDRWEALGDGYRVDAHFLLWRGAGVVTAPESAVFMHEEQPHVFVVQSETAQVRQIKTGESNGFDIEILEGLEEGEKVVRHPDNQLYDGARVRIEL